MFRSKGLLLIAGLTASTLSFADFAYSDFTAPSDLTLNGDAVLTGGLLRLTTTIGGQSGNAWHDNLQDVSGGFTTSFHYRGFGVEDPDSPADGVAFAVQSNGTGEIGTGGGENAMEGLSGAVGINFQSFWNRIRFFSDGNILQDIEFNGLHREEPWLVEIAYNGTTKDWTISLDGNSVMTQNADIDPVAGSSVYAGLGAGTGGGWDNNDVLDWKFNTVPEPATMIALGAGIVALTRKRRK